MSTALTPTADEQLARDVAFLKAKDAAPARLRQRAADLAELEAQARSHRDAASWAHDTVARCRLELAEQEAVRVKAVESQARLQTTLAEAEGRYTREDTAATGYQAQAAQARADIAALRELLEGPPVVAAAPVPPPTAAPIDTEPSRGAGPLPFTPPRQGFAKSTTREDAP